MVDKGVKVMSDYINREDVIRTIVKESAEKQLDSDAIANVIYILSHFEPADVRENVRGEWIDAGEYPWDKCSICGYYADYHDEFNYCPNCGADMRGGNNGKRNDS